MPGNRIDIDQRYCKGCALCTEVCPQRLIEMDTQLNQQGFIPALISDSNQLRCTGCALCARICPDTAINVYKNIPSEGEQTDE